MTSLEESGSAVNSAQENEWYVWYNDFDKNYGPEERKRWYSQAAKAYHWARPRYPDALVDKVIRQAGLKAGDSVLEMGCGPGIATESFARRKLAMQCVEPSPAACELARQTCADYADVVVANSTFEDFWATPPQPSEALCEYLQPVYEQYQLVDKIRYQWRSQPYYQTNFETFGSIVGNSKRFAHTAVEMAEYRSVYSIEKYLALLTTLSDYIALPAATRQSLLNDLAARLTERCGNEALSLTHWFGAQVSPLVAKA